MPLIPISGPISMSMLNAAVGRSSITANSLLANGDTPANPGLFYLGYQINPSLNQVSPHAISEWYGFDSTTTSTTTTTTTVGTFLYKVELCGGGDGPWVVTLASGDLPSGINQAYKLSGGGYAGFNGADCWVVLENPTTDPLDFSGVNFGSVYSNCSECQGTTTTTTSTTTTTTTSAPLQAYYILDDCPGTTPPIVSAYAGPLPDGTFTVGDIVSYGTAPNIVYFTVSSVQYSNPGGTQFSVSATMLSTCPSPTTTTTTTTIPPLTVTNGAVSCDGVGLYGSFTSTVAGGTSPYLYISIDSASALNAIQKVNGVLGAQYQLAFNGIVLVPEGGTWTNTNSTSGVWSGIPNDSSWYVAVRDSAAGVSPSTAVNIACTTTTTTTSTTTTTTTAAPITFYELTLCTAGGPNPAYTTNGPFSLNERVVYAGSLYYTVSSVAKTNPPDTPVGTQISVTSTGETGCPTTTTTTTTTTIPSLTVTNGAVSCVSNDGQFTSTFSGGSGTYSAVAYDTSQANAQDLVQDGAGGSGQGFYTTLIMGSSYQFTAVPDGTWYTAVKDSNGTVSVQITGVTVNCDATTTTSTTTTTTTAQPQFTVYSGIDQIEACNQVSASNQVYSSTNTIAIGAVLTYVAGGATYQPYGVGNSNGWYIKYGSDVYSMAFASIDAGPTACSGYITTTTTTPPVTYDYYDYELCNGSGVQYLSVQVSAGSGSPGSQGVGTLGGCYNLISGPNASPNYSIRSITFQACNCA